MRKNTLVVIALVASCFSGGAFATPVSASLNLQASAETSGGVSDSQTSTDAWGVSLSPLSVSATASAVNQSGTGVSAFGSGAATWAANGLSGTVSFTNYGWNFVGTGGAARLNFGPDWSYTFVANGNGSFYMDYDVIGYGETFGLWGWNISINGSNYLSLNSNDPTTSGFISENLVDGETYTVSLFNNANISMDDGVDRFSGSMDGIFNWEIETSGNTVPEPFSLALVAVGLVGIYQMRRFRS